MKSGAELVKVGFKSFFENAAEDLEKLVEMLKLGKFMQSRAQLKSVTQSINYVTVALLPILTALFEHITIHQFAVDLLCKIISALDFKIRKYPCLKHMFTLTIKFSFFIIIILVDDVQLSCYRILMCFYSLGTGKNVFVERYGSDSTVHHLHITRAYMGVII